MTAAAQTNEWIVTIFETSASGNKLTPVQQSSPDKGVAILVDPAQRFQTITGFGGSFTEASAHLLNKLSKGNREKILQAYFSRDGANYSLTRTHINSCDFSLRNSAYGLENNLRRPG
jgi:glucosylceramidase